jgi:hypothetical protein
VRIATRVGQDPQRIPGVLDEAKDALGAVWDESGAKVLSGIAEVIAEGDPDRACALLREAVRKHQASIVPGSTTVGNPVPELTKGLARVVHVVSRHDVVKAERIARTIEDEYVRGDALCDIAARVAQWEAAGALRIIGTLDYGRDEAMVRIIEVIADRDPDEAEQLARDTTFDNELRRVDALLAAAGALARQGGSGG